MAPAEDDVSASTQYNHIADKYSALYSIDGSANEANPLAPIEAHQMRRAVSSVPGGLHGKTVLDCACGSGFGVFNLLSWGAAKVVGADISPGMINAARTNAQNQSIAEDKAQFVVADLTALNTVIDDGPFDLVTSSWFLNYASSLETMVKMWTVMGRALKPGGLCVALTVSPLMSDEPFERDVLQHALSAKGIWPMYGVGGEVLATLPNGAGYKTRVDLGIPETGCEVVSFENYFLTRRVYEESCRQSNMFAELEWQDLEIPRHHDRAGYWNGAILQPVFRVCTARKLSLRDS